MYEEKIILWESCICLLSFYVILVEAPNLYFIVGIVRDFARIFSVACVKYFSNFLFHS